MKESIGKEIGKTLRQLRHARGWSLDKLAEATGVSKPMLGQIERGASNPTITTMWKIAEGMGVGFSAFLQQHRPDTEFVPADKAEWLEGENGYAVRNIFSKHEQAPVEWYEFVLSSDGSHYSSAHPFGVEEYIFVHEGQLEVQTKEESRQFMEPGDALRFQADHDHAYISAGPNEVKGILMLFYTAYRQ
ncbi:helix-turn-helix domain-containing protein [Marinococcus halophilus]|uniref:helix-turn-helix domain-containing protein n=1 Tax=Marinococcus halophilus TaxID=1371 RepID=UPI0009A8D1E4|nr:XRE family transcriptional regulator [Marinococcus halophilus]